MGVGKNRIELSRWQTDVTQRIYDMLGAKRSTRLKLSAELCEYDAKINDERTEKVVLTPLSCYTVDGEIIIRIFSSLSKP